MLYACKLIAIVLATIALFQSGRSPLYAEGAISLEKLYELSVRIETSDYSPSNKNDALYRDLRWFLATPSGELAPQHWKRVEKIADEFIEAAKQYVDAKQEAEKKNLFGFPINGMKSGKKLGYLQRVTQESEFLTMTVGKYETMTNVNSETGIKTLTSDEIECDAYRYQLDQINRIKFFLQTSVKLLIIEDPKLTNLAIVEHHDTVDAKMNNKEYNDVELTEGQRDLLKKYYLGRVDTEQVRVGEAVEHFESPSRLILNRLESSCNSLLRFYADISPLEKLIADSSCKELDKGDKRKEKLLANVSDPSKILKFCNDYLAN
jgi:hypothetical protein